jgi:hypothetical protein
MSAVANASRENAMTKCAPFCVIGNISAGLFGVLRVGELARTYLGAAKTPASKKVSMSD